jgi:hypothetical protein
MKCRACSGETHVDPVIELCFKCLMYEINELAKRALTEGRVVLTADGKII